MNARKIPTIAMMQTECVRTQREVLCACAMMDMLVMEPCAQVETDLSQPDFVILCSLMTHLS